MSTRINDMGPSMDDYPGDDQYRGPHMSPPTLDEHNLSRVEQKIAVLEDRIKKLEDQVFRLQNNRGFWND